MCIAILGANRSRRCEAQVLAEKQHCSPVASKHALCRPRFLQGLLPRLALRRCSQVVGKAEALGVSFLHLGVPVSVKHMNPCLLGVNEHGSDQIAQLSAMTQLLLDPFYRTLQGFATLVRQISSHFHTIAALHGMLSLLMPDYIVFFC